jgi:hypothetical protein
MNLVGILAMAYRRQSSSNFDVSKIIRDLGHADFLRYI